jgi:hypothetical protein
MTTEVVEWVSFSGEHQDGRQVLVTIWIDANGERRGELATRSATHDIWSPPLELSESGHG